MRVTLNRHPISFAEYFLKALLANLVANLAIFVFPIFRSDYVPLLSMYPEYLLAVSGGLFVTFYIWLKDSNNLKTLDYRGKWKETANKCALFSSAGLVVGFIFPYVPELAYGCLNLSLYYLFLAPMRKEKTLDTWKIEEWSTEELTIAQEDLVRECNPVLYANVHKELAKRMSIEQRN